MSDIDSSRSARPAQASTEQDSASAGSAPRARVRAKLAAAIARDLLDARAPLTGVTNKGEIPGTLTPFGPTTSSRLAAISSTEGLCHDQNCRPDLGADRLVWLAIMQFGFEGGLCA
jgi:hypothetical protein